MCVCVCVYVCVYVSVCLCLCAFVHCKGAFSTSLCMRDVKMLGVKKLFSFQNKIQVGRMNEL